MTTQNVDQKIEKLEQLVLEMGHVIRMLDEENAYCRYWTMDGHPNEPGYVPELEKISQCLKTGRHSSNLNIPDGDIKIIIHIEDGNIQDLYTTVDLRYIVINEDDLGDEPIILGNVEKPKTVNKSLSLQDIDIELAGVEGYDTHPWKGN